MNLDEAKVPSVGDSVTIGREAALVRQAKLQLGPAPPLKTICLMDPRDGSVVRKAMGPDAHLGATESCYDWSD